MIIATANIQATHCNPAQPSPAIISFHIHTSAGQLYARDNKASTSRSNADSLSRQQISDATRSEKLRVPLDNVGMEPSTLHIDVVLQETLGRSELVESPINWIVCQWLVIWHMERLIIWQPM